MPASAGSGTGTGLDWLTFASCHSKDTADLAGPLVSDLAALEKPANLQTPGRPSSAQPTPPRIAWPRIAWVALAVAAVT